MPSIELLPIKGFISRLEAFMPESSEGEINQIQISTTDEFNRQHETSRLVLASWADSLAPTKSYYEDRPTEWPTSIQISRYKSGSLVERLKFSKNKFWLDAEFTNKPSIHLSDCFFKHFRRVDDGEFLKEAIPKEFRTLYDVQQSSLASMQLDAGELKSTLLELARSQAEHIDKITTKLTDDTQRTLQAYRDENLKEQTRLKEREAVVDQKAQDLNLRENRGVRRELLDLIKEQIETQNNFSFTQSTWLKSILVHVACILTMLLGIGLASTFVVPLTLGAFTPTPPTISGDNTSEPEPEPVAKRTGVIGWHQFAPFPAGLILFGSTFIFYIRWMSRWFKNHADSEISNLQYGKDILRASWIAELVFEASSEADGAKKVEIPDYLLQQFCAGLFEHTVDGGQTHPIEDLQKYAKRFKRFKVGAKGIEVEASDKT